MKLAFLLTALLSGSAFALPVTVKDDGREFSSKSVVSVGVRALEVSLSIAIERGDCNRRSLDVHSTEIEYWALPTYILVGGIGSTEAHCPLETPVTETLVSEPVTYYPEDTDENGRGDVEIRLIVPQGYELQFKELR